MTLELLTTSEAASVCRLSKVTLDRYRVRGDGPAFVRVGLKKVAYSRDTLLSWLESRERRSTSEAA